MKLTSRISRFLRSMRSQLGFGTTQIVNLVMSVVVVVVGVILLPVVVTSLNSATGDLTTDYPGALSLAQLIPLLFIVSLIGLALFNVYRNIKE